MFSLWMDTVEMDENIQFVMMKSLQKDCLQIWLLIWNKFNQIVWILFLLKLSENVWLSEDFRGNRSQLMCLNSLDFK